MDFASSQRGYSNLWNKATIRPERKVKVSAIARALLKNRDRYEKIAAQVGKVPWWWVAAIHHMEANADFTKYLGNGQRLGAVTTLVPRGRGPFSSFEAGAIDALRLKKLHEIPEWGVARALYEAERYNGWGYLGKINSPYLWSFTDLYSRGKYVEDHVYDANSVSLQCGVAATFKAFEELGVLEFEKVEDGMAELKASLLPFGGLIPTLLTTLGTPAASLALRAIVEAFDSDDRPLAQPDSIQKKLEDTPLRELPHILSTAEEILNQLIPAASPVPQVRADEPVPVAPVVLAPSVAPVTTVVVSPEKEELGKVDKWTGGEFFAGLKTPIGIFIYCAAWFAGALGYLQPDTVSAMNAVATLLVGVGVTAKIDKVLPWLATITAVIKR